MPSPTSFGQTMPTVRSRSALVVSHHLDGLLHPAVAGLLRPATGQRFIAFHAALDQDSSEDSTCARCALPATQLHTPRRIPLVDSRTASPRPLPSCRYHTLLAPLCSSLVPDRSFGPPRWHRLQTSWFDRQSSDSSARARFEPRSSSRLLHDADPRHPDSGSVAPTARAVRAGRPGVPPLPPRLALLSPSRGRLGSPSKIRLNTLTASHRALARCRRVQAIVLPGNGDHRAPRPRERSSRCRVTEVTPQRRRPHPPKWTPRRPSPARVDGTCKEP